jgi:hypothetical protein
MRLSCHKNDKSISFTTFLFIAIAFFSSVFSTFAQSSNRDFSNEVKVSQADQPINGIKLNGYNQTQSLICIIKMDTDIEDALFSINNPDNTVLCLGLTSYLKTRQLAFSGTVQQINKALSSLSINTQNKRGDINFIIKTFTSIPQGYVYYMPYNKFHRVTAGVVDYSSSIDDKAIQSQSSRFSISVK